MPGAFLETTNGSLAIDLRTRSIARPAVPRHRCIRRRASWFFKGYGDHRDLHSFPTRRSSDLKLDLVFAWGELKVVPGREGDAIHHHFFNHHGRNQIVMQQMAGVDDHDTFLGCEP